MFVDANNCVVEYSLSLHPCYPLGTCLCGVDMSGILGLGLRQPVSQTYHRCALRRASSLVLDPNDSTVDSCLSVVAGPNISIVDARCPLNCLPAVVSTLLQIPIVFLVLIMSHNAEIFRMHYTFAVFA